MGLMCLGHYRGKSCRRKARRSDKDHIWEKTHVELETNQSDNMAYLKKCPSLSASWLWHEDMDTLAPMGYPTAFPVFQFIAMAGWEG